MIEEKVRKIISEQLGMNSSKVADEKSFIKDLGADSLDTMELIMKFEEEFGLKISDEDAAKIIKVGDAIKYIKEKMEARK